jgi:muramidase (phage lysozyme)
MKIVPFIFLWAFSIVAAQPNASGHVRRWGTGASTVAPPPQVVAPPVVLPPEEPVYQPIIGPPTPIADISQQPTVAVLVAPHAVVAYDEALPHELNVIRNIATQPFWTEMPTRTPSQIVLMAKEALRDARVQAFLDIIARAEVADQVRRDDAYKILHGFGMLRSYTRLHPGIKSHGATAAGRYQFTQKTYNPLYYRYPTANLSFHPPGQDLAAVLLLHERGILRFIARNDIVGGVKHGAKTWAGLPYYEDGDRTGNRSFYRGVHKNRSTFGFEVAEQHYLNRLVVYQGGVSNVYIPPNVQVPTVVPPVTVPVVAPPVVQNPVAPPPAVISPPPVVVPQTPSVAPPGSWRVRKP